MYFKFKRQRRFGMSIERNRWFTDITVNCLVLEVIISIPR